LQVFCGKKWKKWTEPCISESGLTLNDVMYDTKLEIQSGKVKVGTINPGFQV
jgi:hypothetical protein